jgi:hypothetical protein
MAHNPPVRRSKLAVAMAGLTLGAILAVVGHSPSADAADDIDLLRKKGGTPYVFFLIDTSGSMVLDENDAWVPGNGDDPRSKLYQVKKALYDVMSGVDNVHYGLATFNSDRLMVRSKHWDYKAGAAVDLGGLTYPTAADEVWTFGRHFNATGEAGTCASPLSLVSDLALLDRFARLGVVGLEPTTLWISDQGKTYQVVAELSPSSPGPLGSSDLVVRLQANLVTSCSPVAVTAGTPVDVAFKKAREFLMVESNGVPSAADSTNCTSDEMMKSVWPYTDVLAANTCGSGSSAPFTGSGWEGNTDSGDRPEQDPDNFDECCVRPNRPGECVADPNPSDICYDLHFPTELHPQFDELDKGDQIPLNWEVDYKDEFLRRLNPLHPGGEDFGIASYFEDEPEPVTGVLQLKDPTERPLVGFGNSPLGRAINDFRCWYLGDGAKCKGPAFDPGWEAVFRDNDLEYGCRVPYLIVISDGEDNSRGENPSADTANLFSKSGVRTFAFTFNSTSQLHSIVQNGKGELILVDDGNDLATKLREVIGFIQQETRTFASAAVPSVQAAVEDKIYLTNFLPLNDAGVWDGHVHSFLKPLPLDPVTGRPNTAHENHLWDAATVMLDQAPDAVVGDTSEVDLQLGPGIDQRRVYFALEPNPADAAVGSWPENRRLFDRTTDQLDLDEPIKPEEPDLWTGLGLPFDPNDEDSVRLTRRRANGVIEKTLLEKNYSSVETGDLRYIIGDIFHSDPLVIGGPVNTQYFIDDAEQTFVGGTPQGTGYRDFFLRHENRRKIVVAGANDGMVHAWDAGKASVVQFVDDFGIQRREVEFDNGTGREIFAYVPRTVLPAVKRLAQDPRSHLWSVDGSLAAADVFIDPLHDGTPAVGDRQWRTVMIGGLREGGSAYYALDVTQPDHLTTDTVGPTKDPAQQREVTLPSDQGVVPDCHDSTSGGCDGPLPYPAPLWELTDRLWDSVARRYVTLDEDGNGLPDLGETWSTPDIGRIRVVEGGAVVNKYVAVFGGGLDPNKAGNRGNFLYILDVETGQVLYKRPVVGSVPSDPAAVDTDQDGYLDRVYFGTTAGFMYRLDLVDPTAVSDTDRYPEIVDTQVTGIGAFNPTYTVPRIEAGTSSEPLWGPIQIFATGGRPIYFPPTVLFVAKLGRYALGFGTGDRDALGFKSDLTGRFYTFVDDSDLPSVASGLPQDETDFTQIDLLEGDNPDLLTVGTPGSRGWFMVLDLEERLISPPFGLVGVTFFATFDPQVVNETCEVGPGCNQNPQCSLSGNSRIYVVATTSANPFLETVDATPTRFLEVSGFVTEPFTEQGVTRNRTADDTNGTSPTADDLTEREEKVMESLQSLFPETCKFGNHRIDIKLIAADTRLERIAAVPICIIEKNWKEVTD